MTTHAAQTIAVGFDGSEASCAAVDWAAIEADRRDTSLLVLTVVESPGGSTSMMVGDPTIASMLVDEARELAAAGSARAAKVLPEARIHTEVDDGSAAGLLVKVSESAALLVVGNTRRSEIGAFFAGSVSFGLAAHAHCPVVLVPEDDRAAPRHGVLVGVDGSPASQEAVTLAADAAVRSGDDLTILCAWNVPVAGAATNRSWPDTDPSWIDAIQDTATTVAEESAAAVRASHAGLQVHVLTSHGPAARALVEAGKDAALVVVGSRGRGGFASLVLGSVSHAVMHHSTSPVLVVR